MDYLQAILLGIIQGASEFLPVSSSGHLLLTQRLLNLNDQTFGLTFDVALHLGTLLALLFYFRRELLAIPRSLMRTVSGPAIVAAGQPGNVLTGPSPLQSDLFTPRLLGQLVVASIPAVIVAVGFGDFIEQNVREPLVVAAMLAVFGIVMLVADRIGRKERTVQELGWVEAILIGVAQAVALVPGVSRSGITITMALFLGLRRDEAARFSFLLAMPVIAGAAAKQSLYFFGEGLTTSQAALFIVGITVAAISGYVALRFLIRFLATFSLAAFTYYRLLIAALVVLIFTVFA
ncbi:MAG TPA: undecaprenyl-diphosphate phosphatase [Chloroflexia bacterium]|nr:undecaprenyl-diphosphate phosphatase [Chloroflexia bacterium]